MYDISRTELQSHGKRFDSGTKTPNSIRSPFWIMVSGLAIFPLTVVTPDSRAYLWTGTRASVVRVVWAKKVRGSHSSQSIGPGILWTRPRASPDQTSALWPW